MNEAMQAHMPGRGDPSALPLRGADRVMAQGPNETSDQFASRLKKAFDAWQHAGERRAILQQILSYVANPLNISPTQVPIGAIVSSSGSTYAVWDVFYSVD